MDICHQIKNEVLARFGQPVNIIRFDLQSKSINRLSYFYQSTFCKKSNLLSMKNYYEDKKYIIKHNYPNFESLLLDFEEHEEIQLWQRKYKIINGEIYEAICASGGSNIDPNFRDLNIEKERIINDILDDFNYIYS